jgi:hypothetical protein
MVDFQDPYRELQLRGRVVEHRPDPQLKLLDAISMRYVYEDRVALIIEADKVRYMKLPFEHTPAA